MCRTGAMHMIFWDLVKNAAKQGPDIHCEADKWQFSERAKHKLKSVDRPPFFNSALKDFSTFCQRANVEMAGRVKGKLRKSKTEREKEGG